MKRCARCHVSKPVDAFGRDPRYKDGCQSYCKECMRGYARARRYGVQPELVEQLLLDQGGQCAVCLAPVVNGTVDCHIDHCHVSNEVRGVLCGGCNRGLGSFRDDPVRLRAAASYLERPLR